MSTIAERAAMQTAHKEEKLAAARAQKREEEDALMAEAGTPRTNIKKAHSTSKASSTSPQKKKTKTSGNKKVTKTSSPPPGMPETMTRAAAVSSVLAGVFRYSTTSFVFLLAGTTTLLSPNLTAVAEELRFSNRERDVKLGGRLKLAYYGAGVVPAILAGLMADVPAMRSCRRYVVHVAVITAQASCIAVWFIPHGPSAYIRLVGLQVSEDEDGEDGEGGKSSQLSSEKRRPFLRRHLTTSHSIDSDGIRSFHSFTCTPSRLLRCYGRPYFTHPLAQVVCGAATGTVAAGATAIMAGKVEGSAQSFAIAVAGVIFGLGQATGLAVAGRYGVSE